MAVVKCEKCERVIKKNTNVCPYCEHVLNTSVDTDLNIKVVYSKTTIIFALISLVVLFVAGFYYAISNNL